jgi:1-phosphofructokinase family hexose kinase
VIVCVAASPSVDKLFEVERVRIGAIHRPASFVSVPGGKGLNVARAAHALGAEVRATGILAGHAGRWIEGALADEGVPGTFAWVEGETRASLSVADATDRGLTEFYERGTDIGPHGWARLEDVVRGLLPGAGWMTISGFVPPGAPDDGYARLVKEAHAMGVRVALDTRDDPLLMGIAAGPDVVKVNAEEAGALLGMRLEALEEAVHAATEIRWRLDGSDRAAIITRGAEGAVVVTPQGDVLQGRLYERGRYPVGSGDAFLGGLVTGLDRGEPWQQALRLALGGAAANAMVPGAGRLDPATAERLSSAAVVELLEGDGTRLRTAPTPGDEPSPGSR